MQTNLLSNGDLVRGKGDELLIVAPASEREMLMFPESSMAQVDLAVAFDRFSWTMPKERVTWAAIKGYGTSTDLSIPAFSIGTSIRNVMVTHA